jgi:hypothetical protein
VEVERTGTTQIMVLPEVVLVRYCCSLPQLAWITEALAVALADEQEKLGIASIPLSLSDRTLKAVIQDRLKLNGATRAADTSAVLSEGEHRAVALAAFLSELRMYPGEDAIIIDDPVSSLEFRQRRGARHRR